ncbi:uncharacterized protein Fot_38964 [Forsythia ovata]|uniref:Uncharacterized protein n=1 Tax=Forsythia ovata TaxID=205694 RepID=A0ABD1S3B5_9LAMI
MAFYGYMGGVGECHWTPSDYEFSSYEFNDSSYYDYCNSSITPAQVNYSVCEKNEPPLIQYEPIIYYDSSPSSYYYDGFESDSRFETNYSVYSYSEPKLVQYEQPPYAKVYFSSATKSQLYNSTEEFNEIEFDDYDTTPYSGGFDPSTTYGSPLPPSDDICYPRSTPQSDGAALEGSSYGSIPSPYGGNEKEIAIKTDPQPHGENEDKNSIDGAGSEKVGELNDPQPHGENEDKIRFDGVASEKVGELTDPQPHAEIGELGNELPLYNHDNGFENGQIPQISYGSGLECMDLCDSLFGYWPCLAKRDEKMNEICPVCGHGGPRNPWDSAADYIFGAPLAYERNNGGCYYHVQQPRYQSSFNSF